MHGPVRSVHLGRCHATVCVEQRNPATEDIVQLPGEAAVDLVREDVHHALVLKEELQNIQKPQKTQKFGLKSNKHLNT